MAKFYFNDLIVKELEMPTILNWFSEQNTGKTIFVRDTRKDTYNGIDFIYGKLNTYIKNEDYYVDIDEQKVLDGAILGFYIGEGTDFVITVPDATMQPIFTVRQERTAMSLGMRPEINKGIIADEVTMGLFHLGTVISFSRDGMNIKDKLTDEGWTRIAGPSDDHLGIMTTAKAVENMNAEIDKPKPLDDTLAKIDVAVQDGSLSYTAGVTMKSYLKNSNENTIHMFLASDIKIMKEKGII